MRRKDAIVIQGHIRVINDDGNESYIFVKKNDVYEWAELNIEDIYPEDRKEMKFHYLMGKDVFYPSAWIVYNKKTEKYVVRVRHCDTNIIMSKYRYERNKIWAKKFVEELEIKKSS